MRHKSSTFNPHPNQLTLGIEFAPRKVRSHGLREAHTYPLVSRGKRPGREFSSFRVAAADAWNYPEIELRSATAWPSIVLDLDGANALERLIYHVEAEHICRPNWAVTRRVGGGTHAVWTLDRPVLRGDTARVAPLTLYGRINEFYAVSLEADPGYNHVLTHNPMSAAHGPAFVTNWGREDAYRLDELAEIIPFGWRVPDIPWTDVGRRVGLFRAVLAFAGKRENAEHDLLAVAIATTQARHNPPLELSYLRGVAKVVERYRARWIARDAYYTPEQKTLWGRERGIRSGVARRKGTPLENDRQPWIAAGVSRATWYRIYRNETELHG